MISRKFTLKIGSDSKGVGDSLWKTGMDIGTPLNIKSMKCKSFDVKHGEDRDGGLTIVVRQNRCDDFSGREIMISKYTITLGRNGDQWRVLREQWDENSDELPCSNIDTYFSYEIVGGRGGLLIHQIIWSIELEGEEALPIKRKENPGYWSLIAGYSIAAMSLLFLRRLASSSPGNSVKSSSQ